MKILITEAHLALNQTEADACRVIDELNRMDYNVEYGTPIRPEEQPCNLDGFDFSQAIERAGAREF